MTKTNPGINVQIDEMRARLTENAQAEQALLRALSQALGEVDQQLLSEVRQVTAEHEARRSDILDELHVLAARLCVFPKPLAGEVGTPVDRIGVRRDTTRPLDQVTALRDAADAAHGLAGSGPAVTGTAEASASAEGFPPRRNGRNRHAPGDWRQATSNMASSNIDDELDFYLDARTHTN